MKTSMVAAAIAALCLGGAPAAQETCDCRSTSQSTALADARYEVVRGDSAQETFRLDKLTGDVWRFQRSSSRFTGLQSVWKLIAPPEDEPSDRLRYQLILPRHAAPLLLNVQTGTSWMLRTVAGEPRWEMVGVEK